MQIAPDELTKLEQIWKQDHPEGEIDQVALLAMAEWLLKATKVVYGGDLLNDKN